MQFKLSKTRLLALTIAEITYPFLMFRQLAKIRAASERMTYSCKSLSWSEPRTLFKFHFAQREINCYYGIMAEIWFKLQAVFTARSGD